MLTLYWKHKLGINMIFNIEGTAPRVHHRRTQQHAITEPAQYSEQMFIGPYKWWGTSFRICSLYRPYAIGCTQLIFCKYIFLENGFSGYFLT